VDRTRTLTLGWTRTRTLPNGWTRTRTLTLASPRAQYEISLRKRSQAAKEKEDLTGNEAQVRVRVRVRLVRLRAS